MNEPVPVPVNNKDWNDIDIFLFSNGQQSSPPRKYHLKADELEFWESTIHYLARTQYGSLHSTIELYTLDGRKINSPLELINATSYVAVKPPDEFIPGGYEQYLIKASRSWEKRQEKLSNMADVTGEIIPIPGEITPAVKAHSKTAADEFKDNETKNIKNPKSLMEKNFDSISTNNTIIMGPRKDTDKSLEEKQREYKPFLTRKSVDSDKIKIIKKTQLSHNSSKDDSIISKKRNMSVSKNFKNTSSRRQSMVMKNDKNNIKTNIVDNAKEKIQPNTIKEETEVKEIIVLSKPSYFNESQSRDVSSSGLDKDLITSSDFFKNPDSEVQSIYIDADRKTMTRDDLPKDKHKSHELPKIEELNDELISSQKHKAISVQSITYSNDRNGSEMRTNFASRAKILTINLNIEVRDPRNRDSNATDRSTRLGKCKSYTALFTADQGSQADININLKAEDFNIDNTPIRKSINSDRTYLKNDGDTKVIVVKCMCESLETHNVNKIDENFIVLVPSTFAENNDESCRCVPVNNNQTPDKDVLKPRHSILNTESQSVRSNTNSRENSQLAMKHKVSICPDSPIKISADMPSQIKNRVLNAIANKKVEQFTQTEWCNVLLQVRPQVNGYSSFYFPPLRVLTQYNLL